MAAPSPSRRLRELRRHFRILRTRISRAGAAWIRAAAERPGRAAPPVLALLTVTAAAVTGLRGLDLLNEQRQQRAALQKEVGRLQREAADLQSAIASIRNDPAALELFARTHHQLVEPGEVVVLLRFPERSGPARPAPPSARAVR